MNETCNQNDCPLVPRVEALERANEQHGKTHRELFRRMNDVERDNAVQDAHYRAIDAKLDELTVMVKELSGKAGKRWEKAVETGLVAIVTGVVCFLLGRIGL